jgi:hypothetical protein
LDTANSFKVAKNNHKNMKYFYSTLAILGLLLLGVIAFKPSAMGLGATASKPTFQASGTTNAKVTVNATSTQVVAAGYVNIAVISTGATAISCSLDNLTAASSSATSSVGIVLPANSKNTFGPLGDIPYLGAINCTAPATTTTVGVTYN